MHRAFEYDGESEHGDLVSRGDGAGSREQHVQHIFEREFADERSGDGGAGVEHAAAGIWAEWLQRVRI